MAKNLRLIQFDADPEIHNEFSRLNGFSLNLVSDCFMFKAGKIESSGIAKIQIHLTEDVSKDGLYQRLIDVVLVKKIFDLNGFLQLEPLDKRKYILSVLADTLFLLAKEFSIPIQPIQNAYDNARERIENFSGRIGGKNLNKTTGYNAHIHFEYGKFIRVACILQKGREGNEFRIDIFNHPPVLNGVTKMFGRLFWNDEGELIVPRKHTNDFWRINIANKSVDFIFERAELKQPHGMYGLGMMYLNGDLVMKNTDLAKYWLKRASLAGYKKADRALLTQ